jgi:hypothetical protein
MKVLDAFSVWRTRFCIYPHQGNSLWRKVAEETIISYRVFTGSRGSIHAQRVLVIASEDTVSGSERPRMVMIDLNIHFRQVDMHLAQSGLVDAQEITPRQKLVRCRLLPSFPSATLGNQENAEPSSVFQ